MILAVFALVLLASMGLALHFVSQTELQMGKSDLETKKVFYLAEAGLEEGRQNLLTTAGTGGLADQLNQAAGPNGVIDFDPDQVKPVYNEAGDVTGFTGFGDDVPLRTLTSLGEGAYAAFLSNDAVDGRTAAADSNDRVVITGLGTGENNAFEMVQAIIEPEFILPQVPIAAITLLGPSPSFDGGDVDCTATTDTSCEEDDSGKSDDDSGKSDDDSGKSDDDSGTSDDDSSGMSAGLEAGFSQGAFSLGFNPAGSDDDSDLAGFSVSGEDDSSTSDDDSSTSDDDSGTSDDDSGKSSDDSGESADAPASGKSFIGTDCDGAGLPNFFAPVVGTVGSGARDSALNGLGAAACSGDSSSDDSAESDDDSGSSSSCGSSSGNGVDNQYVSGGYNDGETFADLTDATEPTVASTGLGAIDATWTSCQSVHDTMETIKATAGFVCSGGTCSLPPTTSASVSFIDGDFQADSSTNGNGLLAVTGRLSFDGDASWHGIILVIGKGEFVRTGGAGDGVITGATVAADISGPDHIYGTDDDCTGGTDGFASASYDEADGQQGNTVYCSNDIQAASPLRSYHVKGFRQR